MLEWYKCGVNKGVTKVGLCIQYKLRIFEKDFVVLESEGDASKVVNFNIVLTKLVKVEKLLIDIVHVFEKCGKAETLEKQMNTFTTRGHMCQHKVVTQPLVTNEVVNIVPKLIRLAIEVVNINHHQLGWNHVGILT